MTSSKVCKRKLAEAPLQQEAGKQCRQTVCAAENTSRPSSSRLPIKERRIDTNVPEDTLSDEDSSVLSLQGRLPTFQAPLAVMHPQVQDSSQQRGNSVQANVSHFSLTCLVSSHVYIYIYICATHTKELFFHQVCYIYLDVLRLEFDSFVMLSKYSLLLEYKTFSIYTCHGT
jgi:hypothetical protein